MQKGVVITGASSGLEKEIAKLYLKKLLRLLTHLHFNGIFSLYAIEQKNNFCQ